MEDKQQVCSVGGCNKPAAYKKYGYLEYRCKECFIQESNLTLWDPIPLPETVNITWLTATEKLLAERGNRYGDVRNNMVCASDLYSTLLNSLYGNKSFNLEEWDSRDADGWKGCMQMICHKLARIVTGDITYRDNYDDIAGYAELARKIAMKEMD